MPTPTTTGTQTSPTTLTLQPNGSDGVDTYIVSAMATTNYGTSNEMGVGEANVMPNYTGRSLLKFDLSAIPANATITSATLSLWTNTDYASNTRTIRVYRLKVPFNETQATWNIRATGSNWQSAGASGANDRESTDIGSVQVLSNEPLNTEKQIALTPAKVQEFVSGTFTNNGFILVADTELDDGFLYKTSEHATTTQRPKLVVQYTLPQGQAPLRLLADTEGKGLLASLRSPVSRLNPGKAHLASYAFQPLQQSGFPAASVLDAFDRANGSIGSSWSGSASGYSISSNRMDVGTGGPLYWNGTSFGADQEAYVTLTNVDPDGNEQDLLLKSQSASSWGSGMIEVIYKAGSVQVWTYHSSQGWVKRGENLVTFSSGDQVSTSSTRRFGARAKANGDVEVYKTCIEFIEITVYCRER